MNAHLVKFWSALRRIVGEPNQAFKRFQKRRADKRFIVTAEAEIGKTELRLLRDGEPFMYLLLAEWSFDSRDGASARFVSKQHFIRNRRVF